MEHEGVLHTLKDICIIKFGVPLKATGRIYRSENFDLDDPEIKERLTTHTLFGVLDLPKDYMGSVNMEDVAFCIKKLYKKEDGLYADIDVLNTPSGRVMKTLIDAQCEFNVKPVGRGIENPDKTIEDYYLETFEIVGFKD